MSTEPKPTDQSPMVPIARCLQCNANFAPGSTLLHAQGVMLHRVMNEELAREEVCGPVVNRWTYHVVGFVMPSGGGLGAVDISIAIPVPADRPQVKGFFRLMLSREWKRRHPTREGLVLLGSEPEVTIIGWELLSTDFRQEEVGPACRICGCTTEAPCEGGCAWVEPDLCSSCADEQRP